MRSVYELQLASVLQKLDPDEYAALVASGAALSWDDAIAEALALAAALVPATTLPVAAPRATVGPQALTARELDVLRELAVGKSNKEIALALGVTPKTAMHHTSSIYRKLGVRSRAGATSVALGAGLVDPAASP